MHVICTKFSNITGPRWTLKIWLIVWGILSVLALAAPGVVAVAMFLIVPGVILIAAPTEDISCATRWYAVLPMRRDQPMRTNRPTFDKTSSRGARERSQALSLSRRQVAWIALRELVRDRR